MPGKIVQSLTKVGVKNPYSLSMKLTDSLNNGNDPILAEVL
jgi:ATP-dependent Lon protease